MSTGNTVLDQYVARLQMLPPFNIYQVMPDGTVQPWFEVTGATTVPELVIRTSDLETQVQVISAQVTHWGRLVAQAQRVWEIEDRNYRIWRDRKCLEIATPDPKDKDWKKPTEARIEQLYRTDADYPVVYAKVERAAEAFRSAESVLDGFRAKRDMMKATIMRSREGGAPTLSI
jgi:hypothetical protein